MLVTQAANMVIGFGSVAVLGRLLTPDHFGLVAIATSLMVRVSVLCDHGRPLAFIRRGQDRTTGIQPSWPGHHAWAHAR
ncbi:MAG: hypothetical protein CBB84_004915 [Phycisphaera sp. TMED24]|nr:MAG: hypothetical protein CBB84_004915 [Phycisphaera sp. TMED24]